MRTIPTASVLLVVKAEAPGGARLGPRDLRECRTPYTLMTVRAPFDIPNGKRSWVGHDPLVCAPREEREARE